MEPLGLLQVMTESMAEHAPAPALRARLLLLMMLLLHSTEEGTRMEGIHQRHSPHLNRVNRVALTFFSSPCVLHWNDAPLIEQQADMCVAARSTGYGNWKARNIKCACEQQRKNKQGAHFGHGKLCQVLKHIVVSSRMNDRQPLPTGRLHQRSTPSPSTLMVQQPPRDHE